MTTLLRGIVGSHAYGLNHEDSDIDRMEVFAAPTLEVAGLDWHSSKESNVKQGPEGDDFSAHEVGKFMRLVLKANPTVSELLWLGSEWYEHRTVDGNMLIENRKAFLSRRPVWAAYHGYAEAQLRKYKDGFTKPKYARHALRLIEQGQQLYTTGELNVQVSQPWRYFDLAVASSDQVLNTIRKALDAWTEEISVLPDEPDTRTVREMLTVIRKNHLED
jgi:hypothetical protein